MNELIQPQATALSAASNSDAQRSIAEVQAAMVLAKQFKRDVDASLDGIKRECQREALAEIAIYEYAKGGSKIAGPSIRLAEAVAIQWGNIQSGWRELDRRVQNGHQYAELEAYAWDIETNRRSAIQFKVKLTRDTKKGSYPLRDEREVYEHCANQARRRERACIIAVIPGYVFDFAVEEISKTNARLVNPERIDKMLKAFKDGFDVSQEHIEKFIQRDMSAIEPGQIAKLGNIYNSLRDGMSKPADWFEFGSDMGSETKGSATSQMKEKLKPDNSRIETGSKPDAPKEQPKEDYIMDLLEVAPNKDALDKTLGDHSKEIFKLPKEVQDKINNVYVERLEELNNAS